MAESNPSRDLDQPMIPGSNFLRGATGMPIVRQLVLLLALAGSIAAAVGVMLWMQEDDYIPLGGTTDPSLTHDMMETLQAAGVQPRLDNLRGTISVPAGERHRARMILAGEDLLGGVKKGYDLMHEPSGFGVSQFYERNMHRMSIEGELERSIMSINAVHAARVILAIPKASNFLRDRRRSRASVQVSLKPGQNLSADQVRAIMNLVAGGVDELDPASVVVVNQAGRLLSQGAEDPAHLRTERDLALVRAIEDSLYEKVASILSRWVGDDRFTAEVNAEIDFTRAESTAESYDPEQSAVRSEQQTEEQRVGERQLAQGVPGTLTNQPPEFNEANPEAPNAEADAVRETRIQSTRNTAVGRTIVHTQNSAGQIERLSVSVLVDDLLVPDAESGELVNQAWSEEDLAALSAAVRSAVGFREERGDTVSVLNKSFYRQPELAVADIPMWEQTWFADVIRQTLGGLAILAVVLGLLRPLFRNLSQAGELVREQQSLAIADMTQMREAALQEAVPGLPTPITLDPDESSAQRMETVRNLVLEDPERVAQVVKHWVREGE
ncbi:MAG: flagellar basal-body MS-ring/collar protein FliF [Pseudomonadota bacterium]